MKRLLLTLTLVVLIPGIARTASAAADSNLFALWTAAHRASAQATSADDVSESFGKLKTACNQKRRGTRVQLMYTAECQRWLGEKWIDLREFEKAEAELKNAYEFYAAALGFANPLSGEVLHLLAQAHFEQGEWPMAGLAMKRALTLLPPIDARDSERCREVFGARQSQLPPEACEKHVATLEMASGVDHRRKPEFNPEDLQYGELQLSGGRLYRGFHKNGKRSGYGLELGADRDQFWRGTYRGGSINGRAVWLNIRDGQTISFYAGGWKGGRRHGYGTVRFDNGNVYSGKFRDGYMDGSGVFRWPLTGSRYIGEIKRSKFQGTGTLIVPRFLTYSGGWKNGVRDGEGFESFAGGLIEYRGSYGDGKPAGQGHVLVNQREVYSGEFNPKEGSGFGIVDFEDGTTFVGQLVDGIPHGFL